MKLQQTGEKIHMIIAIIKQDFKYLSECVKIGLLWKIQ